MKIPASASGAAAKWGSGACHANCSGAAWRGFCASKIGDVVSSTLVCVAVEGGSSFGGSPWDVLISGDGVRAASRVSRLRVRNSNAEKRVSNVKQWLSNAEKRVSMTARMVANEG